MQRQQGSSGQGWGLAALPALPSAWCCLVTWSRCHPGRGSLVGASCCRYWVGMTPRGLSREGLSVFLAWGPQLPSLGLWVFPEASVHPHFNCAFVIITPKPSS